MGEYRPRIRKNRKTTIAKLSGKVGRPKGTRIKRKFEETKLGFFLKYEAPIEYELIMESTPKSANPEPNIKMIEVVAASSHNPVFRKPKFFRYLEEYRVNKLCEPTPKRLTPKREEYYARMLENQNRRYLEEVRKKGYDPY